MANRKKSETVDLNTMAQFLGLTPPAGVQARRSVPRGRLRPEFWRAQFDAVVAQLEEWDYEVELRPGAQDSVELGFSKTITINSSAHPETRFYTLLHEAGHVMIRRRWRRFSDAHPRYLDHPDRGVEPQRRRSKAYRIGLIHEEIEAWSQGLRLAQRMGLFVDPVKFDSDKNDALMTYVIWAGEIWRTQRQASLGSARARRAEVASGRTGKGRAK